MKRLATIVLIITYFIACQKAPELTLSGSSNVEVSADGGSSSITFTANRDWSASSSDSWIHVSPSSGSAADGQITVSIRCDTNTTYDDRSGTVTIRAEELTQTISVKQPANLGLMASPTTFEISNQEQTIAVKAQANVQYTVEVDADAKSWISLVSTKALTESTVNLSIAKNEGNERTGKVALVYESLQEVITIKQKCGVITFEDGNFKTYCVEHFDWDNDGEISFDEAEQVTNIDVNSETITSLGGLEHFTNLESLTCSPEDDGSYWSSSDRIWHLWDSDNNEIIGGLTELDLSKNVSLTYLCCYGNQIVSLDLSNNKALQYLNCSYNLLSSIDVSNNTELQYLNCNYNNISTLDVSSLVSLKELDCTHNLLASMDVSYNSELKYLDINTNNVAVLDLSNNISLSDLNCGWNQISMLDITMLASLWRLNCSSNRLSSIDLSRNPSLTYFRCSWNQITILDVSHNPELSSIDCTGNNLVELDVSNNLGLNELQCVYNPLLTTVWLKEGQAIYLFVYDSYLTTIKYK